MNPSDALATYAISTNVVNEQNLAAPDSSRLDQRGIRLVTNDLVKSFSSSAVFTTAELQPVQKASTEVAQQSERADRDVPAEEVTQRFDASQVAMLSHVRQPIRYVFFKALEQWTGCVDAVSADRSTFTAVLVSKDKSIEGETGEFTFLELSEDDRALVEVGAIFYWSIGYQEEPSGYRCTASAIRFRRLPVWRDKELSAARQRARARMTWFGNASDDSNNIAAAG